MTRVTIDTETVPFGPRRMAPPLVCLSLHYNTHQYIYHHTEVEKDGVISLLSSKLLVGHNVAYDMAVLLARYPAPEFAQHVFDAYAEGRIQCTWVREQLLQIAMGTLSRQGYGLDDLAKRYLGIIMDKENSYRLRYAELMDVPLSRWPTEAVEYPKEDARICDAVFEAQDALAIKLGGLDRLANAPLRSAYAFSRHLSGCRGIMTDGKRVRRYENWLQERMAGLREQLLDSGLMEAKRLRTGEMKYTKKKAKIQAAVLEARGSFGAKMTATGQVSIDRETLTKSNHPALKAISEYTSAEKMMSTYVTVLKEGIDNPIHSRMWMLLTGRYGANKNMQTLPKGGLGGPVRPCYRPRKGFVLCSNDYDTAELRAWSQVMVDLFGMQNTPMAQMYVKDPAADPHVQFAADAFMKISYEEAAALLKSGKDKTKTGQPLDAAEKDIKKYRQHAKAANFGFPGGLGAPRFIEYARMYGVEFTEDEARDVRKRWCNTWNAWKYFEFISDAIDRYGYIIQHRSNRYRGGVGYTDGCNSPFQGLTADGAYLADFRMCRESLCDPESPLYGGGVLDMMHDEGIVEIREEVAHEGAMRVQAIMNEAMAEFTPDVPVRSSPSLMDRWMKDAPDLRREGRLCVFNVPVDAGYPEEEQGGKT